MSGTFEEIRDLVFKLGRDEQVILAEELLQRLDSDYQTKEDYETEWLKEASSRYDAYKAGKIKAIPADQVHKSILRGRKQV
jgi:putative addiction module component (TIGR02574 family)